MRTIVRWISAAVLVGLPMPATAGESAPVQAPEPAFRHPALTVPDEAASVAGLPAPLATALAADLAALGASPEAALYDARAGRLTSLVLSAPLLPGRGVGNSLAWEAGAAPGGRELEARAWAALRGYLERHCGRLRLDLSEIGEPSVVVTNEGAAIQLYAPRIVNGVPVRGNAVTATINHGNLVLLSLANWGDVPALSAATTPDAARAAIRRAGASFLADGKETPQLEIVPADGFDRIEYRLAWVFGGLGAGWEFLIDAVSGELLALEPMPSLRPREANGMLAEAAPEPRSFSLLGPAGAASFRTVVGGVYPVSNDQVGADGTEQPGYPMLFADVTAGPLELFCDAGGNAGCHDGIIATTLSGQFVHIVDTCGGINEVSSGSIDLGSGPNPADTNCTVPAGHSLGDTKASRTAYFVLNRVIAQARGYFPQAPWLNLPITVNVNVNPPCNAFWNGLTLSFHLAGGPCANTGEIASILGHVWANGFDNMVGNATLSRPADGIAGLLPALFFDQSCVGRGYTPGQNCDGYGDPCVACTGLRDVDYAKSASNSPHGLAFAAACPIPTGSTGPCGRAHECEAQIVGEVAWDLAHRDLTAPPFSLSPSTALERATRLFVLTSAFVSDWYQCSPPFGGCSGSGGYLRALAFDDDDGFLGNGTPHMSAIFNAFNRHQMACATPAVADFGCAGGPTAAPTLTVTPRDKGASLSWTAVAGAARYDVYAAVGVGACAMGRIRIGQTTETSFEVSGLQNGQSYSYTVQAGGASPSCRGAMSACEIVVPAGGPNFVFSDLFGGIVGGDGDDFLDNCERGRVTIQVQNTGTGILNNVRIVDVASSSPSIEFPEPFPRPVATTLSACETAEGTFRFFAQGLTPGEDIDLVVSVTADEIATPATLPIHVSGVEVERDLSPVASRTWSFETPGNLEGWSVVQGTWTQQSAGGGGGGTTTYVRSSQSANNACDQIRSPLLRLTPTSTLSLSTNFQIEPFSGGWHDRANVAVLDFEDGFATTIVPNGGRPYDILGGIPGGACVTANEPGWAGTQNTWAASTFNSASLNPGGMFTGRLVRLEVAYATDGAAALDGFRFDEVTLTNFEELVPDTQPDACAAQSVEPVALTVDAAGNGVLQPGESVAMVPSWENARPAAVSPTGGLSAFTGPMPATYTIPDAAAGYGTLAFDASAPCTDCYSLHIAAAGRPAVHWDATALETIAPTGQSKTWTLHVGDSFSDVAASSIYYRFVETLLHSGVTAGCGPAIYCPANPTSREQMAVFVLVAKDGIGSGPPPCGAPFFGDVPASSPYCRWIEELARRGVVSGCGGGNYCPTQPVSREQMAVFALATEEGPGYAPPPCGTPIFGDVPASSGFCRWIEELARRGVVAGCGGGNYCPTLPVTREQMGVFLTQTFGLKLYAP